MLAAMTKASLPWGGNPGPIIGCAEQPAPTTIYYAASRKRKGEQVSQIAAVRGCQDGAQVLAVCGSGADQEGPPGGWVTGVNHRWLRGPDATFIEQVHFGDVEGRSSGRPGRRRTGAGVPLAGTAELIAIVRRLAPGTWLPRRAGCRLELVAKFSTSFRCRRPLAPRHGETTDALAPLRLGSSSYLRTTTLGENM
jgi:hypothetical protein